MRGAVSGMTNNYAPSDRPHRHSRESGSRFSNSRMAGHPASFAFAGTTCPPKALDSRFRGNDGEGTCHGLSSLAGLHAPTPPATRRLAALALSPQSSPYPGEEESA